MKFSLLNIRYVLAVVFFWSITATAVCASDADTLTVADTIPQLLKGDKEAEYSYLFQTAVVKFSAGDIDNAFRLLKHCQKLKPDAAEIPFFLAKCHGERNEDSLMVEMLTRAGELQPENMTYKQALLPIYLTNNDLDKATAVMEDIVAEVPERTDILQMLVQIYNYQNNNEKTLETLNRLEIQEGQTEELVMSKVRLYTKMGDDKKAYNELRNLVDSHPLDLNYRVMLSNWLLGKERKKEAVAELRIVLNEEPDNENALMTMMDYYRAEGLDSLADKQREELLLSSKTQQSTRLLLLKQYIRAAEQAFTDSTEVLHLFDRLILQQPKDIQLLELKLAYMTMKKMPDDTLAVAMHRILDIQPEHAQSRFQLIQMAWAKQDYPEMIRLAEPAQEFNPDEWSFSYFLGVGYFLNEETDKCIAALKVASEHVDETKQKDLAIEMYELMGDALHKTGNSEEAFKAYENCLRLNPDKIACLNNYAYYLSEENRELDKAAAMSLKTIKEEPSNSTYLDTYAWILFLQGRYEEARIYIDMAVKYMDESIDNTVILDHQKQIHAKSGDSEK